MEKKKFPSGFILLIFVAILIIMTLHSFGSTGSAKVSFSHQIEHLVNLNLLDPQYSRQTAQSETLTTFSGKFKDAQGEESKKRFRYLELLNQNHELTRSKKELYEGLSILKEDVLKSAAYFIQISSMSVPSTGYSIIGPSYDTPAFQGEITLDSSSNRGLLSLGELKRELPSGSSMEKMDPYGVKLTKLIQLYRSPKLGIGSETMKAELTSLEQDVSMAASSTTITALQKMGVYKDALSKLESITNELNLETDSVRLGSLRSVRNYLTDLNQYNFVVTELDKNTALLSRARQSVSDVTWFFNNKEISTRVLEKQDSETFAHWFNQAKVEWGSFATNKALSFKAVDQPRTLSLEKKFKSEEAAPNYMGYVFTFLPILIVLALLYYFFSKQMKGGANSAMNFGKSPARLLNKDQNKVTFDDVAGADESKEELLEIVDFLKDPQRFTALGAEIPKGVLLVGPPGTGKTLIAKAVAGEADRPFFSISGSDFVEMFVGVGASRIRDMFAQARKNAPCIIFIDEIDAVGRHRGSGVGGGHDEREQTLNQLLVEMDGFDSREGVILVAATNRPDVLDKALLRPGRFDRRVMLDLPDIKGRFEILKVHARKIKIDDSVELMDIARATPGSSGADLKNILNEAALMAARRGRSAVTSDESREACDKVRFGKERRSLEIDESEKLTTAYHESGHAVVGLVVERSDPVDKVTIIPRGFSLGATHFMPKKNRLSYWRKELIDQLAVLMGGRVAEEIFVEDMSSGAKQDISQATQLARSMVCEWGMSEELGLVSYDDRSENGQYLGMGASSDKSYSDETAKKIDTEIYNLLNEAHKTANDILTTNREKVQLMTDMLMEFESLDAADVKHIMEGTWDSEKKKGKIKSAESLRKKLPPPPPQKEELSSQKPDQDTPPEPQNA